MAILHPLFAILALAAYATPFSFQFFNSDGSAQTNAITMQAWPPSTNAFTVYGTNIVFGTYGLTLTPNSSGYGTNFAYPNSYRCYVSNLGSFFYVLLPDSTQQLALGSCLVSAPQVAGPLTWYGIFTNSLGFAPLASNALAVKGALTYTPATNSFAGLTNALGFNPQNATYAALTNTLAFVPATNGLAALTNTLTDAALVGIHAYRPATNGFAALTNVLGFLPLSTNGLIPTALLPQLAVVDAFKDHADAQLAEHGTRDSGGEVTVVDLRDTLDKLLTPPANPREATDG